MPLSPAKLSYSVIQLVGESIESDTSILLNEELEKYSFLNWVKSLSFSHEFLNDTFPSVEAILEVMTLSGIPWEHSHHRSFFFSIWKGWRKKLKPSFQLTS